ncbi:MAG: hypothetical protein KAJ95_08040, partial [Gammaproteobacteria bacterium]|nr:hypothetical protein [Gammaproteobacteria bacterium]
MSKWQHATMAVTFAGVIMFSSANSYAVSQEEYQSALTELLEAGPATYLNLNAHGKTSTDIDTRLTDIYNSNGLQPFWIENGKPSQRALDIISVLADAKNHGLEPNSYFLDGIVQYTESKTAADLVRLDVLLSLGMMRYVADQREGR